MKSIIQKKMLTATLNIKTYKLFELITGFNLRPVSHVIVYDLL